MTITDEIPDFSGQTVAFYIKSDLGLPDWLEDGLVLTGPTFVEIGGKVFVTGTTIKDANPTEEEWSAGRKAAIALDSVVYFIALPTEEYYQYRDRIEV